MVIDRNTINNIFLRPTRAVLGDTIAMLIGKIISRIITMAQRYRSIPIHSPVITSREINILRESLKAPIQSEHARELLQTALYCIERLEAYVAANPTEATFFAELLRMLKRDVNQLNSIIQQIETFIAEYENREDRANRERIASARGPYIPNSPINTYVIDNIFSNTGNLDANLTSIASIIIRQNEYIVQKLRAINLDPNVFSIDVDLDSFNRPEIIEYLRLLLREIYTLLLPYTEYLREKSEEYLDRNYERTTPRIRTIMRHINDQSRLYNHIYRRIMITLDNTRSSQDAEVLAIARAAIAFETNVKSSIVAEIEEAHNRRDRAEEIRRSTLFDNIDDIEENEDNDSTSTYKKKYLKYKNKYTQLKNNVF